MLHFSHIAAYYAHLYETGIRTARERQGLSAMQFDYSQGSRDANYAAKFFRWT